MNSTDGTANYLIIISNCGSGFASLHSILVILYLLAQEWSILFKDLGREHKINRWSVSILLCLLINSLSDIGASAGYLISLSYIIPPDATGISSSLCDIQGQVLQWFTLLSVLMGLCVLFALARDIKLAIERINQVSDRQEEFLITIMFFALNIFIAIAVATSITVAFVITTYGITNLPTNYCWLNISEDKVLVWVALYGWTTAGVVVGLILILYGIFIQYFVHPDKFTRNKFKSKVLILLTYAVIFAVVWAPPTVYRFLQTFDVESVAITRLYALFEPLKGGGNMLAIYISIVIKAHYDPIQYKFEDEEKFALIDAESSMKGGQWMMMQGGESFRTKQSLKIGDP